MSQFQKASDMIFNALQEGKISEDQAEQLQQKAYAKYQQKPHEKFTTANDKAYAAFQEGKITEDQFKELQTRIQDKYAPETTGERHPDVSFKSRFLMKALATDPDNAFSYMQRENPDLQFRKDASGNILAKRQDEAKWGHVDPPDFDAEDVTDLAWDVPAAVAEGAMGTIGGVKGAALGAPAGPVGMGAGALAGAGLYGGATAGGLESLRQGLGQMAGVDDKFHPDVVGMTTGLGAATPLAFGTGAATKQIAKQALKSGMKQEGLEQAQRGLLGRGYSAAGSKIGQMASGIDSDLLTSVRRNLDEIKAAEASGTEGAEIYGTLRDEINTNLTDKLAVAGDNLGTAKGAEDILVNITDAEQPLRELIERYQARAEKDMLRYGDAAENMTSVQKAQQVESILQPYLKGEGTLSGGYDVKDYLDDINDLTGIAKSTDPNVQKQVKKDIMNATRKSASIVDKQASQSAGGQAYKAAKKEYAELLNIKNDVTGKYFKDDVTTERTVNSLLSRKGKAKKLGISRAMEKLGVDANKTARESVAHSLFVRPSTDALSLGGTTSTSRTVPLAAAGGLAGYQLGAYSGDGQNYSTGLLGGALGTALGAKMGSPAFMRKVMQGDEAATNIWKSLNESGSGYPMIQSNINLWKNNQVRDQ